MIRHTIGGGGGGGGGGGDSEHFESYVCHSLK